LATKGQGSHTAKKSGSAAHYKALQKVFGLQSKILTGVLPHAGKRGSNDEERCRAFLSNVLPRRYGISSGFIVSSTPDSRPSREQDVVIFDDFLNSPLYREPAAGVFPAEMVYATVEVKATLRSDDIGSTFESIGEIRRLAFECWYEWPRSNDMPGRWRLEKNVTPIKRPPRSFIFAFDTAYKTPSALKDALEAKLNEPYGAHLHGIVVVSKGWFGFQHVRKKGERARIEMFSDDGLLRFVNNMLKSLKGVVVREAEMSRYLKIETVEDDLAD
jgi:hypothetical protein